MCFVAWQNCNSLSRLTLSSGMESCTQIQVNNHDAGLSLKKMAGVLTITHLNFPRRVMACDRHFEDHVIYFTVQLLIKTF